MNSLNRTISSIVLLCIAFVQLIISAYRYIISAQTTLTNPLIPVGLKDAVVNFSTLLVGLYLFVLLLNVFHLWKKILFWPIFITSVLIMVGIALFGQQIHQYYFSFVR